jgi:3-isopropylmalate dehydrogenase
MDRGYKIAVIPGDGIGPEVTSEAVKVLKTLAEVHGFKLDIKEYPFGAEYYLATREIIPESAFKEIKQMNAILLGAIGDPRLEMGFLERAIVGRLRFDLDLYINLRPIKLYAEHLCPLKDKTPQDIDIIVVRENTEDVYRGGAVYFKKGLADEVVFQGAIYTRKGTERVIRYAFELARKRRKKLTLCDKANAIQGHELWRRLFEEISKQYPDVQTDANFVDALCMWMVKNPESFDVIVTTNMFGDIITDLGAAIQGGMGIAAGGNIHPGQVSMFEPIHGSAPRHKGKKTANPLAAICAGGMMCEHLGERQAAGHLETSIRDLLVSKRIPSLTTGGLPTDTIGNMVVDELLKKSSG